MANIDPTTLWFHTPDAGSLCRGGGNGENHPSQMYAINKYVKSGKSFLDYGAGSGTTYEALQKAGWKLNNVVDGLFYLGVDIIPKFTEYCKQTFPEIYNPRSNLLLLLPRSGALEHTAWLLAEEV